MSEQIAPIPVATDSPGNLLSGMLDGPTSEDDVVVPDVTEEAPPAKVEAPKVAVAPEPPPVVKPIEAAPVAAKPPEPVVAAAPVVAPAPAPTPAVEAPRAPVQDGPKFSPAEVRTKVLTDLEGYFDSVLTDAEWQEIETNPRAGLKKLLAQQTLWGYEALYNVIGNQIPTVLRNYTEQSTRTNEHESKFFSANPELKTALAAKPELAEQLKAIGMFWRQQNPKASVEQAIEGIGRMAMGMFGVTKAAPAAPASVAPIPIPPSAPARSAGGPANAKPQETNEIADLVFWEPQDS